MSDDNIRSLLACLRRWGKKNKTALDSNSEERDTYLKATIQFQWPNVIKFIQVRKKIPFSKQINL